MSDVDIYLDGRHFRAGEGRNLLEVALELGFDVPYFCWHPALGSVGACRQCAVRLYWGDDDETGEIVMSCMTPIRDRLRASIDDEEAVAFRRSVIEMLMASHPHDCPVCDEGGECHLQDMTVMTGHVYRRHRFRKRTWRNQDLGPFVTHEMNRCIQCYRCVRFYNDYAGDNDFGSYGLRNHVYFGRYEDGALRNEFSGNLVEVCPVGVFNDKTLAETYTRKWDLQTAPSVCPHCARGCNTFIGARYATLRRVLNRYNAEVNGYFLCDRGRFGYQYVNSEDRILRPYLHDVAAESLAGAAHTIQPPRAVERQGGLQAGRPAELIEDAPAAVRRRAGEGGWEPYVPRTQGQVPESVCAPPWEKPLSAVAEAIVGRVGRLLESGAGVIGIGSPRASLEANYALRRLVGAERFHAGVGDTEYELARLAVRLYRDGGLASPSAIELDTADLVIVLGEDITNVAPMLAFTIRKWLRLRPTREEQDLHILRWNDAGIGDVKRYLSSALWSAATVPTRLDTVAAGPIQCAPQDVARVAMAVAHAFDRSLPVVDDLGEKQSAWAEALIYALMDAKRPLVISGITSGSPEVLTAAARLAKALPGCLGLSLVMPEANTMGLALLDAHPLPAALAAAAEGGVEAALILENDLYRRAGAAEIRQFLDAVPFGMALDHTLTPTAAHVAAVLPSVTWAESSGTFVSHEGRAQRFAADLLPCEQARDSWRWLALCMAAAGRSPGWHGLDDVLAAMADDLPHLAPARDAMPGADFRLAGLRMARQSRRSSGRTAMHAPLDMVEPAPPADADTPLSYSMEGLDVEGEKRRPPASLLPRFWAPGWNSVQSLNKFQEEIGGPLRGDHAGVLLFARPEQDRPALGDSPEGARGGSGGRPEAGLDAVLGPPVVPGAFTPSPDEWLIVPLHHIFGSEELSARAPSVASLAPQPYLALGDEDARRLFGEGGGFVRLDWGGYRARLPVRRLSGLPRGIAGVPVGLAALPGLQPPFKARIVPEGMGHA